MGSGGLEKVARTVAGIAKRSKQGIDIMPESANHGRHKAVISATAAQLFVSDIETSCDFFTQKLGFSIVFVYGEPPFYAQVKRDRGMLNLKSVDHTVIDPELRRGLPIEPSHLDSGSSRSPSSGRPKAGPVELWPE